MKSAAKAISVLLVITLVVGSIAVFAVFTNGFTSPFATFYAVIDGERILDARKDFTFYRDSDTVVNVKYLFAALRKETGYTVKITPHGEPRDFYVDGELMSYLNVPDLTTAFEIARIGESAFTIRPAKTLQETLSRIYPGQLVTVDDPDPSENYFLMTITSADARSEIRIEFKIGVPIDVITLDPDHIILGASL